MSNTKSKAQIIAIGGGKGGVGKSTIAANLAVALAQAGQKTVIVDLDLGGANLHTLFGIKSADCGIGDYLFKPSSGDLADYAIATEIENLRLISGNGFIPGIANLEYQRKLKIIRALFKLDAEYIILDLGAGTSYNVVDFFALTQSGIIVTLPEPTAILNAYEFLKNVLYRVVNRTFKNRPEVHDLIQNFKVQGNEAMSGSMANLISHVQKVDPEAGEQLKEICMQFRPALVLNGASDNCATLGKNLYEICRNYLSIRISYLGAVSQDPHVNQSVFKMVPLLVNAPRCEAAVNIKAIARACMTNDWLNQSDAEKSAVIQKAWFQEEKKKREPQKVIDITGILKGHSDTELSSLLNHFFDASVGEIKSRDSAAMEDADEGRLATDADDGLLKAVSDICIEPRLGESLRLPHFAPYPMSRPTSRPLLWFLGYLHKPGHPRHPSTFQFIAQIQKAPMAFDFDKFVEPLIKEAPRIPSIGHAWAMVGLQLVDAGQLAQAKTALRQALHCMPHNGVLANNYAAVLLGDGQLDAAYEMLMEGFKNNPDSRFIQYNIALILLTRKQYDKANDWFHESAHSDTQSVPASFLRAYCLYQQEKFLDAFNLFSIIPRNIPYAAEANFNTGLCLLKLGEYGKAVEVFTGCISAYASDADALAARGTAWWQCGNVDKALSDYSEAIALKPANISFRTARGYMTYKLGKYDLAIDDIQTITRLVPENKRFRALLEEIRSELSQPSLFNQIG
ncbi:MAG: tetratricopeptide repeat protein [Spartobacteria bacterium]|nr:tetratricopeptide repeat protein [Spartobacteria bacterium]